MPAPSHSKLAGFNLVGRGSRGKEKKSSEEANPVTMAVLFFVGLMGPIGTH